MVVVTQTEFSLILMEILFDLVAGKSDEFGYKQRFVIAFEVLAC